MYIQLLVLMYIFVYLTRHDMGFAPWLESERKMTD